MSRLRFVLHTDLVRRNAVNAILAAKPESIVTVQGPQRTLPQNRKMHVMIQEVADQVDWDGARRSLDNWKRRFMDALDRHLSHESEILSSLDGDGYVRLNRSTTDLSIAECEQMIELISYFGAEHGVVFHEPEDGPRPARKKKAKAE